MRSILIRLANILIQILFFYMAYRLCRRLFEKVFLVVVGNRKSDIPLRLPLGTIQYCLPEKAPSH